MGRGISFMGVKVGENAMYGSNNGRKVHEWGGKDYAKKTI